MSKIDEGYIIAQYKKNRSSYDIANELNTYPNKIRRVLIKHGYDLRDKSEAQKTALKTGRSKHPTLGRERTDKEKRSISKKMVEVWDSKTEEEMQEVRDRAKKNWDALPADWKKAFTLAGTRGLLEAAKTGSKAEKALMTKLQEAGYNFVFHKKDLVPGGYEYDLFLPELKTVIEIDGPQHFWPIWGEARLQDIIKTDEIKSGLLLSNGYCIIRLKYLCAKSSYAVENELWDTVKPTLEKIAKKFPRKGNRYIELELIDRKEFDKGKNRRFFNKE